MARPRQLHPTKKETNKLISINKIKALEGDTQAAVAVSNLLLTAAINAQLEAQTQQAAA